MSRTVSPSSNRTYGLLRVAQVWSVSRATVYRQRRQDASSPLSKAVLTDHVPAAMSLDAIAPQFFSTLCGVGTFFSGITI
jgi:hypothetical protein